MAISVYGVSVGAHKPFVDEEMDSRSHRGARRRHCRLGSHRRRLCQHRAIAAGRWSDGEQRLLVLNYETI